MPAIVGDTVILTCTLTTWEHLPNMITIGNESYLNDRYNRFDVIKLPSREVRRGEAYFLDNVTVGDSNNYSCSAIWSNPKEIRITSFILEVIRKFTFLYEFHFCC